MNTKRRERREMPTSSPQSVRLQWASLRIYIGTTNIRTFNRKVAKARGERTIFILLCVPLRPLRLNELYQCCVVVRPAKADAFSGRQSHQGKSQTPCSLDGREERNQ